MRFSRAYTPNAICSPARASLMTGLLPHNHGVLWVTQNSEPDQGMLREARPHWAALLAAAGYRTGYFGKWHVEKSEQPYRFGWSVDGSTKNALYREARQRAMAEGSPRMLQAVRIDTPGYDSRLFCGVTKETPEQRDMGIATSLALQFIEGSLEAREPWCCFVSVPEPHDPYICGEAAFDAYEGVELPGPSNGQDNLAGRPNLYRKSARVYDGLSEASRRMASRCYFASITEIDSQFGRIIDLLESSGALDSTVVVVLSDHGDCLGAHGLYCKNIGAFEEIYRVPLIACGPGISAAAAGSVTNAVVGTHALYATLLDLVDIPYESVADSRSFAAVLNDPVGNAPDYSEAYAEYHGGRFLLSQRVLWQDDWKLVWNGFDFDELYDLASDPGEMCNLADLPEHRARRNAMMSRIWDYIRETGDESLLRSGYPPLRLAEVGPEYRPR